jgi:aryl-alcohol dehydrogenase-like predicted oxidoreductase
MTIEKRALGRAKADVTILGYGAMELRGLPRGPEIDDDTAGRLLNAVLDGGINLIDTSPDYGRSEELIGRFVGHRRDEYFLASDLVQVHMSPSKAQLEENRTVETLRELRDEGKVRFIGMSGILPNLTDHIAMDVFNIKVAEKGPLPADVYAEAKRRLPR